MDVTQYKKPGEYIPGFFVKKDFAIQSSVHYDTI